MAKQSQSLSQLTVTSYYVPMSRTHATFLAFASRLEQHPSGEVGFSPDAQPQQADLALRVAHMVMLTVLEVQEERFKPNGLREALEVSCQELNEIWPPKGEVETDA